MLCLKRTSSIKGCICILLSFVSYFVIYKNVCEAFGSVRQNHHHPYFGVSSSFRHSKKLNAKKNVVVIGAGWGGLSVAHHLLFQTKHTNLNITLIDAAPRVGGVVRDGYSTNIKKRTNAAEAGQHGFWDNYYNIFNFLENDLQPYIQQKQSSSS